MQSRFIRLAGSVLLLAILATGAAAQDRPTRKELPNFHKVNENLYRGAQPGKGGIKKLAELKIKTVVNLRGRSKATEADRAEAEAAGLYYFNVEMPAWGRPGFEQVSTVLNIINSPEYWPVFIHCKKGADRTGTILACYRIENEGWTEEGARSEAKHHGMHWSQVWMKDFISDFAETAGKGRLKRSAAEIDGGGLDNKAGAAMRVVEMTTRKGQWLFGWLFEKLE